MRIAIEVFGTQSESRHRGVGRYTHEFVDAVLDLDSGHEFVLYAQDGAPTDYIPGAGRAEVRLLRPDAALGDRTLSDAVRRLLGTDADGIDAMLLCNPLELRFDYTPPAPPLNGIKMATILYDLIPLLFPEHYIDAWPGPEYARLYFRAIERIRRYDGFLAISGATAEDFVARLGIDASRVANIRAGSDTGFFTPDPCPGSGTGLDHLGITGPFVYSIGAMEYRKNVWGLLDAFGALPGPIRSTHQLVLSYAPNYDEAWHIGERARRLGFDDRLVLTGRVDDETLRALYRRCSAFVFPSRYEGFGLPVHEAMLCGAAVVAGDNSSQVEIVGEAGLLADVNSADDIRSKLMAVLADPATAARLRRLAPSQAAGFTWGRAAALGVEALEATVRRRKTRADRSHSVRPRIAMFSPLPPLLSGISDYTARLVESLQDHFTIDLYHDQGYVPDMKLASADFACHDHRLFRRNAAILGYRACVYQMGNGPLHKYLYENLPLYPGLVALHDFSLAGFRYWDAIVNGKGHDSFREELAESSPEAAARYGPMLDRWSKLPGGVIAACAREELYLNRRIFEHATGVIFNSPWGVEKARSLYPDFAGRLTAVPYGATAAPVDARRKAALRGKYGLPADALIVGNFGLIHPTKLNVESLRAFAQVAGRDPEALFLLVGPEYDDGASRACVAELGLEARVRFLGARPAAEFVEIVATADIGLNLRLPPTNGETSSSLLDLLRQGVPTIITDVGTFSDFPDHAVRKLPWGDSDSQDRLGQALMGLAESRASREDLGRAAVAYVREKHDWSLVATRYAEAIEATIRGRERPRASTVQAPHLRLGSAPRAAMAREVGR